MSRMRSENTTPVLRLVNLYSGHLSEHSYDDAPPYVAVSHTWRAELFPPTTPFVQTAGGRAVLVAVQKYFPSLSHCWVDTLCIIQDDEQDKQRQIPMMGEIYHGAVAVTVALGSKLTISQEEIDTLSEKLEGACFMAANETWREDGLYWKNGAGKEIIIKAMNGLEIFTRDEWACRIWTLQEFVLARSIVWIGSDCIPLRVREILFSAIPDICNTLSISECIGGKYTRLYSYFSGMMNCKRGAIDRTRIMELLGNRSAIIPADEIYGAMAASGVIIDISDPNHSREYIWRLWCEQAIREGHIRWALLPPYISSQYKSNSSSGWNCVLPDFHMRHHSSSALALDSINPVSPVSVNANNGAVTMAGRWAGSCKLIRRLGSVYEDSEQGHIHRDITLIILAGGNWLLALRLALAFGAGRYNRKQTIMIARVLQSNFTNAIRVIERGTEENFRPRIIGSREATVWADFMTFQMSVMPGMNYGVAYLVEIRNSIKHTYAVAVFGDHKVFQPARLEALHFEANTTDDRWALMIVQRPDTNSRNFTLHKAAMTLPLSLSSDINSAKKYGQHVLSGVAYQQFSIGGSCCFTCSAQMTEDKLRENRQQQQQLSQYSLDAFLKARVPEKMVIQIKRRRSILIHQRYSSTRKGRIARYRGLRRVK